MHDHPELDERNLETPREPLQQRRFASARPFRLEFLVLAGLIGVIVLVLVVMPGIRRLTSPTVTQAADAATPEPRINGIAGVGDDIVRATPAPRGVPIGNGQSVLADARHNVAGAINSADPALGQTLDNARTALGARTSDGVVIQPPPVTAPEPIATPRSVIAGAPLPGEHVPAPLGGPPAPTIASGPTTTTTSSTSTDATSPPPPHITTALVSGGAEPTGPRSGPAQQPTLTVTNANDAIGAQRRAFASSAGSSPIYLNSRRQDPISRYEIFAGTPIRMHLDDGINSSQCSDVYAHLTYDIHASLAPYPVLIPAHTTVKGRCNASVVAGDNRLELAWDTMILPDGSTFDLQGMPAADQSGEGGLRASSVDDHRGRIFTTTLLSAVLAAGLQLAQPAAGVLAAPGVGQQAAGAVGSSIAQTGQQIVAQQVQRPPTLTVERGREFIVRLRSTIVLEPNDKDAQP
jgi:type IV secretory pathway VirB10-like protein